MRLNKFLALARGISRRQADELISAGRVSVNGGPTRLGQVLAPADQVVVDDKVVTTPPLVYLALHKPAGYVCSRHGQGAPTIYELLPKRYHDLKSVGRLDKDTSGLLMLSNDGDWAQRLTHPKYAKAKTYELELDRELSSADQSKLTSGVKLEDGLSQVEFLSGGGTKHTIRLRQGRNRQIRRSFAALGYQVTRLHRREFGRYRLNGLKSGEFKEVGKDG